MISARAFLIFVVIIIFASHFMPAYGQEDGFIKVISPTEDCAVFIDGIQIGTGTITTKKKPGMHNVAVTLKDKTPLYNEQVESVAQEIVVITVSYELKKKKPVVNITRSQFNKDMEDYQSRHERPRRFVIRPIFNFADKVNIDVSKSNYNGSGNTGSYDIDFGFAPAVGAAIEGSLWQSENKRLETLIGASQSFGKNSSVKGRGALTGSPGVEYDSGNIYENITSVYCKLRYLLAESDITQNNPYLGCKVSFNMTSYYGDVSWSSNLWGFGVFVGMLFNDDFDLEIADDFIQGPVDNYNDGSDTLKGTFTMQNAVSVSLGYRL
jgi:hypothetical protein